jgi:two-component system, LuxR family, sensor histidine kinase DctS
MPSRVKKNSKGTTVSALARLRAELRARDEKISQLEARLEQDLRHITAHRRLLSGVVEWLPVALFCKDYSSGIGKFVLWNHAAEKLWGLKSEEAIGKSDYDFFPKDQADIFRNRDLATINKGELLFTQQEIVDSPAGRRIVDTWKVPVRTTSDKPPLLLGISLDTTERSELEKQLEWEHAKRIESSRLASLGEMAAGIAHEINNPLAIIHAISSRMKQKVQSADFEPNSWNRDLGMLTTTVERIVRIIRGLKTIAHSSPSEPFTEVSVKSLVDDTLEFCRERFRLSNVGIRIVDSQDIKIHCRPSQISQVLINLLNNAYDAVAALENPWVEIKYEQRVDEIEISVTDSGDGIPPEVSGKIMEPFFTTKGVGQGTGLGLSISKDIVEAHGGRLALDLTCKHTKFSMFLPSKATGQNRKAA